MERKADNAFLNVVKNFLYSAFTCDKKGLEVFYFSTLLRKQKGGRARPASGPREGVRYFLGLLCQVGFSFKLFLYSAFVRQQKRRKMPLLPKRFALAQVRLTPCR